MNKKAYISPVLRATRVSTTHTLLSYSNPEVGIASGNGNAEDFEVKGQTSPSYNVWDDDWSK